MITLTVFIVLVVAFGLWLFRTEHLILTAKPGETTSVDDIPTITAHRANLNDKDVPIYRVPLQKDFRGYACKDEIITVMRDDSAPIEDVTLQNNCQETVTIEIWWYSFRLLNHFIPLITDDY